MFADMTRAAHAPLPSQMAHQLFLQYASRLNEQAAVDGLVRHAQSSGVKSNPTTHAKSRGNCSSSRHYCGPLHFHRQLFRTDDGQLGAKVFLLHLGIGALFIPLVVVERWSKGVDPFRGKPRWVIRSMQILFLLFVVVFFTFLALSHAASPEIINGEYVLNSHGTMVGHISERDYLLLKGWELRLFASGWILAYYAMMMYWHTPEDTLDKVDPRSLAIVGHVLVETVPALEKKFESLPQAARQTRH